MHDQQVTVTGPPAPDGQRRRRVWVLVVVGVVVGVAIAVGVALLIGRTAGQGPDAEAGADNPADGQAEEAPAAGAEDPAADDAPTVGDSARLPDGAVARINGLEPDVTLDPGLPGPEPGMRLDRVDVELCAGSTELFVDAAF